MDFGASDGPMSDEQLGKVDGKLLHIPTVLWLRLLFRRYNVDGVRDDLKFSGKVLAGIYWVRSRKWS